MQQLQYGIKRKYNELNDYPNKKMKTAIPEKSDPVIENDISDPVINLTDLFKKSHISKNAEDTAAVSSVNDEIKTLERTNAKYEFFIKELIKKNRQNETDIKLLKTEVKILSDLIKGDFCLRCKTLPDESNLWKSYIG